MPSLVLTVKVVEAALRESGDGRDAAGENVVNVALLWPRPGKAEAFGTTGLVRLSDHARKQDPPDRPPAFAAPVLKEVVEGEVALLVHVLDRDRSGAAARFLQRLAGAALRDAGAFVGADVPGLVRYTFTEAVARGSVAVGGAADDDERLDVVAVAEEPVVLSAADLEELATSGRPRREPVMLSAPQDLRRSREKGRLAAGRANGHLVLELSVARR